MAVLVGERVLVGVSETVAVGVFVGENWKVLVAVAVQVLVGVLVGVLVNCGVLVGVKEAVFVGELVGVLVLTEVFVAVLVGVVWVKLGETGIERLRVQLMVIPSRRTRIAEPNFN